MSLTPDTFESELFHRLGRDYRLRWSPAKQMWSIEQKVDWTHEYPGWVSDWDDEAIRARDGFAMVCEVSPRPFLVCEGCGQKIPLPELTRAEVRCAFCKEKGEKEYYVGAFFPLCEKLLQRLEYTSPRRGPQWKADMDIHNRKLVTTAKQDQANHLESIMRNEGGRILGIPSVGYTGKVFGGQNRTLRII
jgi:hypothetical protein